MENLIEKAIDLANRAHSGQKRKGSGLPYIVHPAQVASMLMEEANVTEAEIAAAWLHDVFEDTENRFHLEVITLSPEVAKLVEELTNPSKGSKAPRAERKAMDREHLAKASWSAKRIKLIDRYVNLRDIVNGHSKDFIRLYANESELLLNVLDGIVPHLEAKVQGMIDFLRKGL